MHKSNQALQNLGPTYVILSKSCGKPREIEMPFSRQICPCKHSCNCSACPRWHANEPLAPNSNDPPSSSCLAAHGLHQHCHRSTSPQQAAAPTPWQPHVSQVIIIFTCQNRWYWTWENCFIDWVHLKKKTCSGKKNGLDHDLYFVIARSSRRSLPSSKAGPLLVTGRRRYMLRIARQHPTPDVWKKNTFLQKLNRLPTLNKAYTFRRLLPPKTITVPYVGVHVKFAQIKYIYIFIYYRY